MHCETLLSPADFIKAKLSDTSFIQDEEEGEPFLPYARNYVLSLYKVFFSAEQRSMEILLCSAIL